MPIDESNLSLGYISLLLSGCFIVIVSLGTQWAKRVAILR
jgi:hypothetical protein